MPPHNKGKKGSVKMKRQSLFHKFIKLFNKQPVPFYKNTSNSMTVVVILIPFKELDCDYS